MGEGSNSPGWVYLIHAVGTNRYKIGKTFDIDRRLAELSYQSPYPLKLISSFKSDNPSQDEHALHEKFLDNRVHGEWFEIVDLNVNDFCPTLSFRTIKNLCVKYLRRLYLSTSVEDIDSRRILILTIVFCQKSKIRSEIETVYFFLDKIEQILSFANTEGFNCELYVKNQIKNVFPKLIKTHDYKS